MTVVVAPQACGDGVPGPFQDLRRCQGVVCRPVFASAQFQAVSSFVLSLRVQEAPEGKGLPWVEFTVALMAT
eukprot:15475231-Alexandrium_andersonii.AAC.1